MASERFAGRGRLNFPMQIALEFEHAIDFAARLSAAPHVRRSVIAGWVTLNVVAISVSLKANRARMQ